MLLRTILVVLGLGALATGVGLPIQRLAHQGLAQIDCPRGQTVWIVGAGEPDRAVLVMVEGRVVGGAQVDRAGRWRVPLVMNEPSGSYLIRVVDRDTHALQSELICLVGPQAAAGEPPTATMVASHTATVAATSPGAAGQAPTTLLRTPTTLATAITAISRPSETPVITATPQQTATATRATATRPTNPTSAPSATATPQPTSDPRRLITPSPTAVAGVADRLYVAEVMAGDPESLATGSPVYGFVELRARVGDAIDLQGWQLLNLTQPTRPTFTFPALRLLGGGAVIVMPDSGVSNAEFLYWGIDQIVWESGDRLALRTPQGLDALTIAVP